MKLHFFIIMTIGMMFLFYMAGIDTGSSKVVDYFGFSNQNDTVNINPSFTEEGEPELGTFSAIKNYISSNSFYFGILAFLIVVVVLSLAKVSALSFSWNPSTEGAFAVLAIVLWGIFSIDVYSVIKFTGEITGRSGWAFNLIRIFLYTYLVSFALSLITFIRTGE